jgi:hypothetical protein
MRSEYSFLVDVIRILTCGFSSRECLSINQLYIVVVPGIGAICISDRAFLFDK